MSFVRVSRPRQSAKARRKPKPKPSPPPWDDTTSDLSVHRSTDDEMKHRHEVHQSKNLDVVRLENQKMMIQRARSRQKTPTTVEKRKAALLREVLYDHSQLQDVLSKSDRVMAVVRDLFGDDPKRYTGFPNVTKAPDNPSGKGPVIEPPEQPTQLSMLSQSIMDQSALNEVEEEGEQGDVEDEQTPAAVSHQFESRLDLQRFHRFLQQERQQDSTISSIPGEQHAQQGEATSTMLQYDSEHRGETTIPHRTGHEHRGETTIPHRTGNRTPIQTAVLDVLTPARDSDTSGPTNQAINDTAKVKRTRSRTEHTDLSTLSLTKLDELKQVMDNLEAEIADFEQQSDTTPPPPPQGHKSPTLRGYTTSLLQAITRLTRHIKESESQLRSEATLRHHLTEEIAEQRALVDVLTADIINTQEQYTSLREEFDQYRAKSEEQINYLKHTLYAVMKSSGTRQADSLRETSAPSAVPGDLAGSSIISPTDQSAGPKTIPNHLQPLQPAVLLSPPRQRDQRAAQQVTSTHAAPTSLADLHQRVSQVYRTMGKVPSTTTPTSTQVYRTMGKVPSTTTPSSTQVYRTVGKVPSTTPASTQGIVISQPTEVSVVDHSRDSLGTSPLLYNGDILDSGVLNGVVSEIGTVQPAQLSQSYKGQFTQGEVPTRMGRPMPVFPPAAGEGRGSLEAQLSVLAQQHTQAQRRAGAGPDEGQGSLETQLSVLSQQHTQAQRRAGAGPDEARGSLETQLSVLAQQHTQAQRRLQLMEEWRRDAGTGPQDGETGGDSSPEAAREQELLQQQIDVLLHKHAEAQARLQGLVQQQQQISLERQLNTLNSGGGAGSTGTASTSTEFTQLPTSLPAVPFPPTLPQGMAPPPTLPQGTSHAPVSPPISPIPFTHGGTVQTQAAVTWGGMAGREILVNVPRVEDLELTATSTPSPHLGNNSVARSSLSSTKQSPIPVILLGNRPVNTASTEDGWFALSAHVS